MNGLGEVVPVASPPQSADLSCLDFLLWVQLKSLMFETLLVCEVDLIVNAKSVFGRLAICLEEGIVIPSSTYDLVSPLSVAFLSNYY
ncbi:hypothetical protein NPIL_178021 [Nephila pilipes]|uniref:Uncharacterized protein n=1 Tax=Nephila pilipes TaxID=299642 RepID=A0A8X6UAA6_NEPPI|nr:hypothetical protein NPIL_178021 [Nephila pilipes]